MITVLLNSLVPIFADMGLGFFGSTLLVSSLASAVTLTIALVLTAGWS